MFQDDNKMCVALCAFVVPRVPLGMHVDARAFNLTCAPHTRTLRFRSRQACCVCFSLMPWSPRRTNLDKPKSLTQDKHVGCRASLRRPNEDIAENMPCSFLAVHEFLEMKLDMPHTCPLGTRSNRVLAQLFAQFDFDIILDRLQDFAHECFQFHCLLDLGFEMPTKILGSEMPTC